MRIFFTTLLIALITTFSKCSFITRECNSDIKRNVVKYAIQNGFTGSILITYADSVLVDFSLGYADSINTTLITSDTPIPIASITKLFVKHAVLKLVDEGKLSLEDKLSDYKFTDIRLSDKIKIKDLLNHTSGLPDIHNEIEFFSNPWALKKQITSDQLIGLIDSLDYMHFKPGERSRYSNSNYLLLANILEQISNIQLDKYLDSIIFKPFGMKNTGLYNDHSLLNGHARGFFINNRNEKIWMPDFNFRYFWGSGNAFSTINDLLKYTQQLKYSLPENCYSQLVQHSGYYLGYRTFIKTIPELDFTIIILSTNGTFNYDPILDFSLSFLSNNIKQYNRKENEKCFSGEYSADINGQCIVIDVADKIDTLFINNTPAIPIAAKTFVMTKNNFTIVKLQYEDDSDSYALEINDNGHIIVFKKIKN